MNSIISKLNPVRLCGCWPAILRTTRCPSGSFLSKNPIKRADPGIYSQPQVLLSGGIPTWDNPDIQWFNTNSINVRIRNFSRDFSVGGALVHCDLSRVGIGQLWSRVGSQRVNLDTLEEKNLIFVVPDSDEFMHKETVRITIEYHQDSRVSNNFGEQQIGRIISNYPGPFESDILIINNTQTTVTWHVKVVHGNAKSTRDLSIITLEPGQGVGFPVRGLIPPAIDEEPRWCATVIVEDADGNLVGGITYQSLSEDL